MRFALLTALLLLAPISAEAGEADGAAALSLAAQVGSHSASLPAATKARLTRLAGGHMAGGGPIRVRAGRVFCRTSNVDITHAACDLDFGHRTVSFQGRAARGLMGAMGDAGIDAEGAAGSTGRMITALDCRVNPRQIARRAGGGAHCAWSAE